jgi:hypothetical protein
VAFTNGRKEVTKEQEWSDALLFGSLWFPTAKISPVIPRKIAILAQG